MQRQGDGVTTQSIEKSTSMTGKHSDQVRGAKDGGNCGDPRFPVTLIRGNPLRIHRAARFAGSVLYAVLFAMMAATSVQASSNNLKIAVRQSPNENSFATNNLAPSSLPEASFVHESTTMIEDDIASKRYVQIKFNPAAPTVPELSLDLSGTATRGTDYRFAGNAKRSGSIVGIPEFRRGRRDDHPDPAPC